MTEHDRRNLEMARKLLDSKLILLKLRKTAERYRILDEIYSRDDHFDVEALLDSLLNQNFVVSKATIYNVLELFVELGLVTKHHFGDGHSARYEKAFGRRQHSHIICTVCGKVEEFCDPRLLQIQNTVATYYEKSIHAHSLVFYGVCVGGCK